MMRRRHRIPVALAWIALVIFGGISINLFLALRPAALEARLRAELSQVLGVPFAFTSFTLGWDRGAEIRNLRVYAKAPPGDVADPEHRPPEEELISIPSVRILPRLLSLAAGRFEIRQVIIGSPRIRLARDREGKWSVDGVVAAGPPGATTTGAQEIWNALAALPSIRIEGGRFSYDDAFTFREPVSETLDEVFATFGRSTDGTLQLKAQLRVPFARKVELKGNAELTPAGPVARFEALASKIDLSQVRDAFLPAAFIEEAKKLQLKGFLDLAGRFKWDGAEGLVPISAVAELLRVELSPPYCPHPIKGLKGRALFSERKIELQGCEGAIGAGKITASSTIDFAGPWLLPRGELPAAAWRLQCGVDSFLVDQRLRASVPPALRVHFEEYKVDGPVGIDIHIADSKSFPPKLEEIAATVRFEGVDFIYFKFPYLVTDVRGEAYIKDGRVVLGQSIQARNGPIELSVSGRGAALYREGDIHVVIKAKHVPIDEKLRQALPGEVHGIWDDFQLLGTGDTVIEIAREALPPGTVVDDEALKPRVTVSAFPSDARMSYRRFPYEITGISGIVHFDTIARRLTLDTLKGQHRGQEITGLGVVDIDVEHKGPGAAAGARTLYQIGIKSDSVVVDEDLVAALSDDGRRLLADFNFKGRVKADVSIRSTEKPDSELKIDVSLLEGSVKHRDFQFPVDLASGRLEVIDNQTLVFSDVSTPKDASPLVVFGGTLTTQGTERTLGFDVHLDRLKFDEKFVEALPRPLASFVTSMKLGGSYRGKVEGTYTFDELDPNRANIVYHASDVSADEASVDFGVAIHDMIAKGNFTGGKGPGKPHHLLGQVQVESAWFNRLHLTKGTIDFTMGVEHPAVQIARNGGKLEGREYLPPAAMLERLSDAKVRDTFQMLVHSPDVYGGKVDGFVYVDAGTQRDMAGDFVGGGFSMAQAANDVFGAKGEGTTGTAGGKFSFRGKTGDLLTIQGSGMGTIENARLVELPLFLGILSVIFGEGSGRHYFNEVLLKYDISNGKFVAPSGGGIEIRSPGIKLLGGGTMDFAGNLDLVLEPRVLDFKIPIVEQIFSVIKKGLAQVLITGELARPKVHFATAAGILQIGIDSPATSGATPALPSDLRGDKGAKDLPPGPK